MTSFQSLSWLLVGIASAGLASACGSSSIGVAEAGPGDKIGDDSGAGPFDAASSGADAALTPKGPATILVFVHGGSPDLAPFRICVDPSGAPLPSDFSHPMPQSNYPGIPAGGAGSLGDMDAKLSLNVTLVDALALANSKTDPRSNMCSELTGFLSSTALETISAPVLLTAGKVNVAVVRGSNGSRTIDVVTLDATGPMDGKLRLQFGQVATGLGMASAAFGPQGAPGTPLGSAGPSAMTAMGVDVSFDPSSPSGAFDTSGVTVTSTGMPRFFSLTAIQGATDPTTVPTDFFTARVSYAVIAIGDSTAADAAAGNELHLLAVPAQL